MYCMYSIYLHTHTAVSDMSTSGITDQGPSIRPKEVNRMKKMKKTWAKSLSSQQQCSMGPVIRAIQLLRSSFVCHWQGSACDDYARRMKIRATFRGCEESKKNGNMNTI